MKPILSILEPQHFSEVARNRLSEQFDVTLARRMIRNGGPIEAADAIWCRLQVPDLRLYPEARVIACNMTDVSHLPLAECQKRGIEVLSLQGIEGLDTVHATAEHTISLMLQALRHRCDRSSGRIGRELRGKSVSVFGCGRVGKQVLNALYGLGVEPLPVDIRWSATAEPIWNADIVSIHASLNDTSRGMVNAEFLSKLKPGCILVNTARHAIIKQGDVFDWLKRDPEAIYAHDFSEDSPMFPANHPQVIETPHIGGWTIESLHRTEELLAEKVIEWAKNKLEVTV